MTKYFIGSPLDEPRSNDDRKPRWLVSDPRRLQLAVFILVGAVSLLGVFGIENAEQRRRHAALERNAADIAAALRQLDSEQDIFLRASAALLATHDAITAPVFSHLQQQLKFDYRRQGSLGMGWAEHMRVGDLHPAWTAPRNLSVAGLHDNSAADGFPIVFLDPLTPENSRVVGFDGYAEPERRAAMDKAAAIGAPVATGRIELPPVNGRASQSGFLIYMPVFGLPGSAHHVPLPSSPPGPLRGYVFMPFQAAALLANANQSSSREKIRVAAYDGIVASDRLMAGQREPGNPDGTLIEHVQIGNRPWQLVVSADRPAGLSHLSQITILSGLIVALLLAVLIHMTYQKINEERALLEWKASEDGIRNSLTRELNHRVKNSLATVLSIVALTRRRETDLDNYVASLSGRIRALSATHDLLTSNDWSSIELRQIIVAEMAPYLGGSQEQVSLHGPDIQLAPNDSLTLGLAVHELATNAAKYGALSALAGRIAVRWKQLEDDSIEIHWQETGGPVVTAPYKRGFGRELIERILARELNAPVKLDFAPEGLQCVFRVPLRKPGFFMLRAGPQSCSSP